MVLIKKLFKIAAVLAVIALVAVGIATLAIRHYLPPEKLKALVVNEAQKALGREVSVTDVSADFIHGLLVKRLAISEKPDFKAGRFAEADSFVLRLRLMPLLHRRIEVDKISADGLKLNIVQRKDGTFNFSDMIGSTTVTTSPAPASDDSAISLFVKKASLRDAQVSYRDMTSAQEWKLSAIDAKVSDFQMDGLFSADLDFHAEGRFAQKPISADTVFSGKLDLGNGDPARMRVAVKQLRIRDAGREVRLSGKIQGWPSSKLDVAAQVDLAGTEIFSMTGQGDVSLLGPRPAADLALKLRTAGFKFDELQRLGLPIPAAAKGLAAAQTNLEGGFRLAGDELSLDKVKLETKLGRLEVSGRVAKLYSDRPEPDLQAALHLDLPRTRASAVPFAKLPEGLIVPASIVDANFTLRSWDAAFSLLRVKVADSQIDASGTLKNLLSARPQPQDFKAKLHLDIPQTKASDAPFLKLPAGSVIPASIVDAEFILKSWDASFSVLRMKASGISVDASGTLADLLGRPVPRDFKAKLHVDIPKTKAADVPFVKLPPGLLIPACVADATLRLNGEDVFVDSFRLKTQAGQADVKGALPKALAGRLEPNLQIQANLDLPAWKSEDLPFAQIPAGLAVPASRLEISAAGGLDDADINHLRVILGKNDLEASGKAKAMRSKDPSLDLMLKCRAFLLDELTPIAPQTRELKLSGSGFFALGISGPISKPVLSGKMKFKDLGATVAGLPLSSFTGTASFDENRIDIPNLSGKVADGTFAMDLTVKHYRRQPAIDLEASLDRFDLGRYLAAKKALQGESSESAKESKAAEPFSIKGKFLIGALIHPNMTAKDVNLSWELDGVAPGFRTLDGWAKLAVAGGNFSDLGKMAGESVVIKVLTLPLMIIQKIGGIGGIHIFPDFNHIVFTEIAGDYAFANGLMTMKDTHLYSNEAQVNAQGTVDLPSEKLDLLVAAQVGRVAPIAIKVTGTFTKPQTKMQVGEFIKNIFRLPVPEAPAPAEGQ